MRELKYECVVIGTSAGGLSAIGVILGKLPSDFRLPVLLVQHRSKDSQDLFEDVLQRKCSIPVVQAEEKERIVPGRVYVAPPDYHLLVEADKTLSLSSDHPVQFSRPSIDVLFESAAAVYRSRLVGVILTGSNSDGAAGVVAIDHMGGLTIAQDPDEAQYSFMVRAAIDTNKVREVLSLARIGDLLAELGQPGHLA